MALGGNDDDGTSSLKHPPRWSVETEKDYPFTKWESDVRLWIAVATLDDNQIGPAIALRLTGAAREVVRESPTQPIIEGINELQEGVLVHVSGWEVLLNALRRRFAPLEQEQEISAITELFQFRRRSNETIDEVVSRFELTRYKAAQQGRMAISEAGLAYMLLMVCGINQSQWPLLLAPLAARLPRTPDEYSQFMSYLRRQSHFTEKSGDPVKRMQPAMLASEGAHEEAQESWPSGGSGGDGHYHSQQAYELTPEYEEFWDVSDNEHDGNETEDLTDLAYLAEDEAYELLAEELEEAYWQYRRAKRRWKTHHRSGRKGKGKGKGRRKGSFRKGKGSYPTMTEPTLYGKGKGKRNPRDKEGNAMKCSICGSEEHLRASCPKRSGGAYVSEPASSVSGISETAGNTPAHWTGLMIEELPEPMTVALPAFPVPYTGGSSSSSVTDGIDLRFPSANSLYLPVFECYHSQVRLKHTEGLVIDPGAVNNVCGDMWARRVEAVAKKAGQGTAWSQLEQRQNLQGVGSGTSTASQGVALPFCLEDGTVGNYRSTVLDDSPVPGLLGLATLKRLGAILDLQSDRLIIPGPGGVKMHSSPGSKHLRLYAAPSGHLILPMCEWQNARPRLHAKQTVLATTDGGDQPPVLPSNL